MKKLILGLVLALCVVMVASLAVAGGYNQHSRHSSEASSSAAVVGTIANLGRLGTAGGQVEGGGVFKDVFGKDGTGASVYRLDPFGPSTAVVPFLAAGGAADASGNNASAKFSAEGSVSQFSYGTSAKGEVSGSASVGGH
jgi:hypothetical protein